MSDAVDKLMQRAIEAPREHRPTEAWRDWAQVVALSREAGARRAQAPKGLGQIERDLGHADAALLLYD